jgi:hypothetical protein
MSSTQDDRMQVAEAMLEFGQTSPVEASTKYETDDDGDDIWNNPDYVNAVLASVETTEQWVTSKDVAGVMINMQQYDKASTSPCAIHDFDSIWEDAEFVKAAMCAANEAEATNVIERTGLPAKLDDCNLVGASIESASPVWQLPEVDDDEDEDDDDDDEEDDGDSVFLSALVEK